MANKTKAVEEAFNYSLARLLREEGLNAEGEVPGKFGQKDGQVDVSVQVGDSVVALEAEFGSPAKGDASKRLSDSINPFLLYGLPIRLGVAIGYPSRFKQLPESQSEEALRNANDLRFTSRKLQDEWTDEIVGSVSDLVEVLRNYWVTNDSTNEIEEIVQIASHAIEEAGDILNASGAGSSNECSMKALIWLNALLFQHLLSKHLDSSTLPSEFSGASIPSPDVEKGADHLIHQWAEVLRINWWPIFQIAKDSLKDTPPPACSDAIAHLKPVAFDIASRRAIRQHDIAGRIFHRLLDIKKFLATNYTTIPAAIVLAGLALDRKHASWTKFDFGNIESISELRIVDPSCGTGTLLMAAAQELMKHSRVDLRHAKDGIYQTIVEQILYGYDVVPAAVHLAASTLCMSEPSQFITDMKLWRLRHDAGRIDENDTVRLGSLDFLLTSPSKGNAQELPLVQISSLEKTKQLTGTGQGSDQARMPHEANLIIANPPYTRAGGPGDAESTQWNPIFGWVDDKEDERIMNNALKNTLESTPASFKAGLGSAFVVLADQYLAYEGRLAFVLPLASISGSSWARIRRLFLDDYSLDWIITSHDTRFRRKTRADPGRHWSSFSESTRMAEVLIVATKTKVHDTHNVKFLNLVHNPDDPIEAISLTTKLLEIEVRSWESAQVRLSDTWWGEILAIPQETLTDSPWHYTSLVQADLTLYGNGQNNRLFKDLPLANFSEIVDFGPYHTNIKSEKQGLFHIFERTNELQSGHPAIWHHDGKSQQTMAMEYNACLQPRNNRSDQAQQEMLARSGKLHFAAEMRLASQRVSAVMTTQPAIGVRSWITITPKENTLGAEECLCLWLNSTFGILLRLLHGNRPYLGRSEINHSVAKRLPVLDITKLSRDQLKRSRELFDSLATLELATASNLDCDSVRAKIDELLCKEVLNQSPNVVREVAKKLAIEPNLNAAKL